jgi:hypothetical protein
MTLLLLMIGSLLALSVLFGMRQIPARVLIHIRKRK